MEYGFNVYGEGTKRERWVWWMKGPSGAIHIWAQFMDPDSPPAFGDACFGGVECHYPRKPYEHCPDEAPIKDCWLTGRDCWPDGSSLYFSERLQPLVEAARDPKSLTEYMNVEMLNWYRRNISRDDCPPLPEQEFI